MPEPQPGWAQQYDADMHPAWAREFEPPAITGGESQAVMMTLLSLYQQTGQKRFAEPIPRALAYYEKSRLPDGRLARFYELRTNKPLYITHDDPLRLTYSDKYVKSGYNFKVPSRLAQIKARYERLTAMSTEQLKALGRPESVRSALRVVPPQSMLDALAPASPNRRKEAELARAAIASLDEKGRWVETGTLNYHRDYKGRFISCATFIRNVRVLSTYLAPDRTETGDGTEAP
jgi:hypothetical protein